MKSSDNKYVDSSVSAQSGRGCEQMEGVDQEYSYPESGFLLTLFAALNTADIRYAVLRNYETLPFSVGGSDLDVLVATKDAVRAQLILYESTVTSGGTLIGTAKSAGFSKFHVIGRTADGNEHWWGVCIDINSGLYFHGLRLLEEGVSWPVQQFHGIQVLMDGFAGVLGVLKEVLNNEEMPERYAASAREVALNDWLMIEKLLAPMGAPVLTRLRGMLLHSIASHDLMRNECKALRHDLFRNSFAQDGIRSLWQYVAYKWTKVRRLLKPSGIVLAILGVDGAGKSTVINAILPVLNVATHNTVVIQHLRPTILPPLARLKGKTKTPSGPKIEPHGSKPSGAVASLFRLVYLTMDYILGYWLWTRPKIAKQPAVVIFDRYAYDMGLDPRRFCIGLPGWVAAWFSELAPRPDLIICLHGEPEVISARKQELSLEETRRQVDALKAFADKESRAVLISTTDTSVEGTRDLVLHALIDYLQVKASERL